MTLVLRPALQSKQSSLCGLHRSRDRRGGVTNGQIVSIKRAPGGRRQRSRKIIDKKREKYRAKNGSLWNTSTDSKGTNIVDFDKPTKRAYQKGKIESNEQSKEGCQKLSKNY